MKLGIMQPYFFPYLGYFHLIDQTDLWIVFDTPQYIYHGWINRNRILHPQKGWQYIVVPIVKHSQKMPINEIQISENEDWRKRILGQLNHYRKAPFYSQVTQLVERCLEPSERSLSLLNVHSLKEVCAYLDISFEHKVFSTMQLDLGPVEGPGDWSLRISEALGAKEYMNPESGRDLFDAQKFKDANIELTFQKFKPFSYEVKGYPFEKNLSIIDVMMWNPPEKIKSYLASMA